jgi:septum formation protein
MQPIILASQSPRRQQLLQSAEIEFTVVVSGVEEDFDPSATPKEIAAYLAKIKAEAVAEIKGYDTIIVAADTVVAYKNKIYNKPVDDAEAICMLQELSGNTHKVITGVCILSKDRKIVFTETTEVIFYELSQAQIEHYVKNYQPFDKAGGYAIQEWIGLVGIKEIIGDYYNVMGLPVARLLQVLRDL